MIVKRQNILISSLVLIIGSFVPSILHASYTSVPGNEDPAPAPALLPVPAVFAGPLPAHVNNTKRNLCLGLTSIMVLGGIATGIVLSSKKENTGPYDCHNSPFYDHDCLDEACPENFTNINTLNIMLLVLANC